MCSALRSPRSSSPRSASGRLRPASDAPGFADSPAIVIDEVAGQWIALLLVPADPVAYGMGFVLFRLFDVAKPWPIGLIDRHVKGGFGVMLDDVVAGGIAALVLWNIWVWL